MNRFRPLSLAALLLTLAAALPLAARPAAAARERGFGLELLPTARRGPSCTGAAASTSRRSPAASTCCVSPTPPRRRPAVDGLNTLDARHGDA